MLVPVRSQSRRRRVRVTLHTAGAQCGHGRQRRPSPPPCSRQRCTIRTVSPTTLQARQSLAPAVVASASRPRIRACSQPNSGAEVRASRPGSRSPDCSGVLPIFWGQAPPRGRGVGATSTPPREETRPSWRAAPASPPGGKFLETED